MAEKKKKAKPKKKNKGGRPPKNRRIIVKKLERCFLRDLNISEACLKLDISRTFYHELIKEQPELSDRFELLRNNVSINAKETVADEVKIDPKVAMQYLRLRNKDYKEKI
jgi:hypothetical protein